MNQTKQLNVKVWRGGPESGAFEAFDVPSQASQTVLDVVAWIQQNTDPSLSYRYACRVGMCGSCAMMVNGVPRWTCRTHVNKVNESGCIEIAPLRNLPVIKDLAADMDPFFDKWVQAEGVYHGNHTRDEAVQPISPQSEPRQEVDAGIECINCAVCFAACDTVTANDQFLGPAALNRAWTLLNDAKDNARATILDAVSGKGGCHNCHSMGNCSQHCPNDLNPMRAIAGLKRAAAQAYFSRKP